MNVTIFTSPYRLTFPGPLNAQSQHWYVEGVLLKFVEQNGNIGYSSLQSWESLGDEPFKVQLEGLKNGKIGRQMKRSLQWGLWDLCGKEAPSEKLQNYQSFSSQDGGSQKLKIGIDAKLELNILNLSETKASIILDANNAFNLEQAMGFWNALDDQVKKRISYIEDFVPYQEKDWQALKDKGISLAWDFQTRAIQDAMKELIDVIIVKPARDDWKAFISYEKPLIFTHYMDHPLGVQAARYEALSYQKKTGHRDIHGLSNHKAQGVNWPKLEDIVKKGWGLKEELESLSWSLWIKEYELDPSS